MASLTFRFWKTLVFEKKLATVVNMFCHNIITVKSGYNDGAVIPNAYSGPVLDFPQKTSPFIKETAVTDETLGPSMCYKQTPLYPKYFPLYSDRNKLITRDSFFTQIVCQEIIATSIKLKVVFWFPQWVSIGPNWKVFSFVKVAYALK